MQAILFFMIKNHNLAEVFRNGSMPIAPEMRYGENFKWEDSGEFYEMDREFSDDYYYSQLDFDSLLKLIRHMDNFICEHGISDYFLRNFEKCASEFKRRCNEPEEEVEEW